MKSAEQPVDVGFTVEAERECRLYQKETGRDLKLLVQEILEQDPRPASQRRKEREYGMLLWDMNVRWRADKDGFTVIQVQKNY